MYLNTIPKTLRRVPVKCLVVFCSRRADTPDLYVGDDPFDLVADLTGGLVVGAKRQVRGLSFRGDHVSPM